MVLVTVESLRVDHVGAYGGISPVRPEVPVTPALDAFARRAVVYERAHAVSSWTLAAHASLFTGLYPSGHQTVGARDRLHESYPTLAEVLSRHGYQTAGVVSGPYLRRSHNLHQGFELWDDSLASLVSALAHDDVTNPGMDAALERFLDEQRDPERPFLLFAYYWDPHYDFLPPPPYDELFVSDEAEPFDLSDFAANPEIHPSMSPARRAYLLAQYAGELRATDEHLGRLFRGLQARGLWDRSLVIVTADHGEEFFDHGEKGHKNNLYAETVRVPLIVKYPGQERGRRDERLASQVDILPTVLDVAGISVSFPLHGRSLRAPSRRRPLFFELLAEWWLRGPDGAPQRRRWRWSGVRQGDFKLVWREGDGEERRELFDLARDPEERVDLSRREPERERALARAFAEGMERIREDAARYEPGGTASLAPEEIEQLRELGYLAP